MTKIPWKGQETFSDHQVFVATKAGQCVSVDQLISTQVGFIAQFKGSLTNKRNTAAMVFVDHYSSKLKYMHLMTEITSEETMEAKRAFEHFTKQHDIRILHYHCNMDNLQTMLSRTIAVPRDNILPFAGSTLTSKTTLQKRPSATSARALGSSSSMRDSNGQLPSTWPFGHML
jgi:hypothetical protein